MKRATPKKRAKAARKAPAAPPAKLHKHRKKAPAKRPLSTREKCLALAREKTAAELGGEAREQVLALWYAARSGAEDADDALKELLATALCACQYLDGTMHGRADKFAPFVRGWPFVLAAGKERAHEWGEAKERARAMRAGEDHGSKRELRLRGSFAEFVSAHVFVALFDGAPKATFAVKVTLQDLPGIYAKVLQKLAEMYGPEWQDAPDFAKWFGGGTGFHVGGESKPWKDCGRWEKRDIVRDKFEGAFATYKRQLQRIAKAAGSE